LLNAYDIIKQTHWKGRPLLAFSNWKYCEHDHTGARHCNLIREND
jgi:hypothetical protein